MSEQIISIDSHAGVAKNIDQAVLDLKASRSKNKILTGELVEIGTRHERSMCIVSYKGQIVYIPMQEMGIVLSESANENASEDKRLSRLAQNMLGGQVQFVVTEYSDQSVTDPETNITYTEYAFAGSCKRAKEHLIKHYFGGENPLIKQGTTIEVSVAAISKNGSSVRVNAFGQECRMSKPELLHEWVGDLHQYYKVGDKLLAKVEVLEMEDGNITKFRLNSKCLKPNKPAKVLEKLEVPNTCVGKIVGVAEGRPYYIHLNNGANCVCYEVRTNERIPCVGDKVLVAITGKRSGNALGIITNIL